MSPAPGKRRASEGSRRVPARRRPGVPRAHRAAGRGREVSQRRWRTQGCPQPRRRLQPHTYQGQGDEDGRRLKRQRRLRAVRPGPRAPAPPLRSRPASLIGCCATGPRLPRPISAEQRRLETFSQGPGAARPRGGPAAGGGLRGSGCRAVTWRALEDAGCSPDTRGTGLDLWANAPQKQYDSLPLTPIAFPRSCIFPKSEERTKILVCSG